MRGFCVNKNGVTTTGLAKLNHHMRDEQKEVRADGGHGLSEEDESRINEDVNCRRMELVVSQPVMIRPQQQPQVPVIMWDRFLPRRSLKVLLVENDDSTRHVVSALLRNCSYEVMAVGNGLEAWKIIEDLSNQIDLVLTEVVMPHLSGICLLCKIMNHATCKNIPVIMMSSNDSMGIVFKCLSKGAVDFLVKPIRKNELKNLWQHVWRKCHSSSGSGSASASESGIRTQKSTKLKSDEESDNNSGSNDEADNESIELIVRDGSDDGSATQSSWTKRAVEVDSRPKPMSPWEKLADPRDSTRAKVILHSKSGEFSNNLGVPKTATEKKYQEQDDETDLDMGKDLEIGVPSIIPDLQFEDPAKKGLNADKITDLDVNKNAGKLAKGTVELNTGANPQMESVATEIPKDIPKITNIRDKEIPSLALSLKTTTTTNFDDMGTSLRERNVLRHSDLSAFSRYNTNFTGNQAPNGNVGSCSPPDISSEAAKTETTHNNVQSKHCSNNSNDMGSTTTTTTTTDKPPMMMPKSSSANLQPSPAFQPVSSSTIQPLGKVQVQHHHHHYHHHHHHVHNTQKPTNPNPNPNDDVASGDNGVGGPRCGPSSNVLITPIEGNTATYYSLNGGSASGSNNGNGGQSGSDNNGTIGKFGAGCGSGSGSGIDQNQFALREAALNKFRQKRKERCFDKKVRYESRKKLAEERPRVRGQFVRQENNNKMMNNKDQNS